MKLFSLYNSNFFDSYKYEFFNLDRVESPRYDSKAQTLKFDLPGFAKENVELSTENGYVKVEASFTDENGKNTNSSCVFIGDDKEIESATMLNGLLTVKLKSKHKSDKVLHTIS